MRCQRCGKSILPPATVCGCASEGAAAPPTAPSAPTAPPPASFSVTDAGSHVIPTRNKPALIGYYLAIASIVPYAAFLAIPAVVLGVVGLGTAKRVERGMGHAITAIVVGLASMVLWGGVWAHWWSLPIAHPFPK